MTNVDLNPDFKKEDDHANVCEQGDLLTICHIPWRERRNS